MTDYNTPERLFDDAPYYDLEIFVRRAPIITTHIARHAELHAGTKEAFELWYNDGAPPLVRSVDGVVSRIVGKDSERITLDDYEETYQNLATRQHLGKAAMLAWCATEQHIPYMGTWQQRNREMTEQLVRVGLVESVSLLAARYDEEADTVVHLGAIEPKHFWNSVAKLFSLRDEGVEGLEDLINFAGELHLSLLHTYPYIGEYLHQRWKYFGEEHGDRVGQLYASISARDEAWRQQAGSVYRQHVMAQLAKRSFGRAGVLMAAGRHADILDRQFIRDNFMRKFNQLDLRTEIPRRVMEYRGGVFTIDQEFSGLSDIEQLASSMCFADRTLSYELQDAVAARELEVVLRAQSPDNLEAEFVDLPEGFSVCLEEYRRELIARLPGTSPERSILQRKDMLQDAEAITSGALCLGALSVDRSLELWVGYARTEIVSLDELFTAVDAVKDYVLRQCTEQGLDDRTFELFIGYISPLCRLNLETNRHFINQDFIATVCSLPVKRNWISKYIVLLRDGPRAVFDEYWAGCEEYIS